MAPSTSLVFRLLGIDESASETLRKVGERANATASSLGNIGKAGAKWAAMAQGAASAYQAVSTLAPAAALVAPAALAGAQALGVLKLGSDQVKASFSALNPQVERLKAITGHALAPGLNSLVRSLKSDLPVVTNGVRATATVFGDLARRAGQTFSGGVFSTQLARIMSNSTIVIGNVGGAVLKLARAFVTVAAVAAPTLGQLSAGLGGVSQKVVDWVDKVNRSRQLSAWITQAVAGLHQLVTIVSNVLHTVVSVLGAISSTGGSALGLLVDITGAIRAVATSTEFLTPLKALFTAIHQAVGPLLPVLGRLVVAVIGALVPAVTLLIPYLGQAAGLLGGALIQTVTALGPSLAQLAPQLGRLAVAAVQILIAALPLVPLFVQLVAWIAPAVVAVAQFTAMVLNCRPAAIAVAAVLAAVLIPNWIAAGRAATTSGLSHVRAWLTTARTAWTSAVTQVRAFATTIAGWVRAGAAATASAARQVWAWLAARAAAIPAMVSSVLAFGAMIGGWIATAAAAVAGAIAVAAAWLLSIWPIVLVVAAVAAAVFLIIKYWSDIVAAAEATFSFIARIFMDIVHFFERLPGEILRALGSLGSLLFGAGRDLVAGLINGIRNMASEAVDAAKHVVGSAVDGAKHLLGIHSPSTVFFEIGTNVTRGLVGGLAAGRPRVAGAGAALAAATVAPGSAYGGGRGGPTYVHVEIHGSVSTLRGQANELAPHLANAFHRLGDSNGGTIPGVT